jgi:hypothetical protein
LFQVSSSTCCGTGRSGVLHDIAPICERQASSSRCVQLKHSPAVRPTTSAPWLRRITASLSPRSRTSDSFSSSFSTTPSYSW